MIATLLVSGSAPPRPLICLGSGLPKILRITESRVSRIARQIFFKEEDAFAGAPANDCRADSPISLSPMGCQLRAGRSGRRNRLAWFPSWCSMRCMRVQKGGCAMLRVIFAALLAVGAMAPAAELKVMSVGSINPGLANNGEQFKKDTGNQVTIQVDTAPGLSRRLAAGETRGYPHRDRPTLSTKRRRRERSLRERGHWSRASASA